MLRSVAVDISRTSFARGIFSRTIRTTAVIVRLDRTIQYSETVTIEPMGRGVLDRPLLRAMTAIPNLETGVGDGFSDVMHLEKRGLTKDVRLTSTVTDCFTR